MIPLSDILTAARTRARIVNLETDGIREVFESARRPGHYLWQAGPNDWRHCEPEQDAYIQGASADAARDAVRLLCEGLTDAQLVAEIESIQRVIDHPRDRSTLLYARAARAALETDRDRRRKNLPEKP